MLTFTGPQPPECMEDNLATYYAQRAAEYEAIYHKPERQADLWTATQILQPIFKDQSVLEIACGTGYWTERIAGTAREVLATDLNQSVIDIAQTKTYPRNNVRFKVADLYALQPVPGANALFGGFIWSHIPRQELAAFLQKVNRLIPASGTVVWMDNRYVAGSNTPISHADAHGNTYQERRLRDGSRFSVLKNFPERPELESVLAPYARQIEIIALPYYWLCRYQNL